jgi:riboflavin synthase
MFTGLVEDVGEIVGVRPTGRGRSLEIKTALPVQELMLGDSVAVDGACLTVDAKGVDRFVAVAGRETLARTTLADARPGRAVHLERALKLGDRVGGHLVQGHVDGVGRLERVESGSESVVLWIALSAELARYVASKGSICLDGVSLTVNELDGCRARVNVVPHTARVTRLGALRAGDTLNVEVDVLAKYVERLLGGGTHGALSLETLARSGFLR